MQVKIEEIREGGLSLDEQVPQALIDEALASAGFVAEGGFNLKARLQKVGSGVLLKGEFESHVRAPCKRCNQDVHLTLPAKFTLNLVPTNLSEDVGLDEEGEDDEKGERAGTFSLDDPDEEPFDGKVIQLDPIVREQLLLSLPMHALCKEECLGLCGQCGKNLNEGPCACEKPVGDVRWAALRDIKLN